MSVPWRTRPDHLAWLGEQTRRQLAFGRHFPHPDGGAGWLDRTGEPDLSQPVHCWITARMAHVYSLGALAGVPGCGPLADTALAGLTGRLHDDENGGWYSASDDTTKSAYAHAFVLLAASTASVAGRPGARALLDEAAATLDDRFLTEAGLYAERWDAAWTTLEPYRGVNANMHGVEAMLAAYDATGEQRFLDRAVHVADTVVAWAAANDWRVPEHFDEDWQPLPEHHRDQPDHPFEPFGATVGHGLEWSRLLLTVDAATGSSDRTDAARALFDRAATDGWAADGHDGFVYTTDWDGTPIVRERMHWVVGEAICAAAALHGVTGEAAYDERYRTWWDHAAAYWIADDGSWAHQLAPDLSPSETVWKGRPDLYHSLHAVLLPRLPLWPAAPTALGGLT